MISSEQIDGLAPLPYTFLSFIRLFNQIAARRCWRGGIIALSTTLYNLPLEWLNHWWPTAPIALGGYLIYRARQEQKTDQGE